MKRNVIYLSFIIFKILTLINFIGHLCLALPVLGYNALDITKNPVISILFGSHILTLILSYLHGYSKRPSVIGGLATLFGFIPFLGWMMHFTTAIITGPMSIRLIVSCKYSKIYRPVKESLYTD